MRDIAVTNGQMGPAINAEYRRGQLAGFYIDRKEVVTASLDNMTRPELEAKLKEIRDHNIINGEAIGVEVHEVIEDESSPIQLNLQNKLNFDIEIDGGINFNNCKSAIDAGANILVSGTTVFKSNDGDIKKNINLLKLK